jgi:hypothetical protein
MEVIRSSETSVNTISTRRHIPEDCFLHSHHREKLKSYETYTVCEPYFCIITPISVRLQKVTNHRLIACQTFSYWDVIRGHETPGSASQRRMQTCHCYLYITRNVDPGAADGGVSMGTLCCVPSECDRGRQISKTSSFLYLPNTLFSFWTLWPSLDVHLIQYSEEVPIDLCDRSAHLNTGTPPVTKSYFSRNYPYFL